jgi:sigma-B regulation protein RsbU (phosphoserine phosphatase)
MSGWIVGAIVGGRVVGRSITFEDLLGRRETMTVAITGLIAVVVGLVFRSLEVMRNRLTETVARLKEHEWAEKELEMARSIQTRLLPPQRIEGDHFVITARNLPARLVAGDFYDVVKLDDGSVAIIVADVAGKGMGASLIMASVKAVLPFVARNPVEEAMSMLNDKLVNELDRREFVALAFARFFPSERTVHLANAGFPDPYLIRGDSVQPLPVAGLRLPLGIRKAARYQTSITTLLPRDRLLFISDGLPEAPMASDQPLGYDRLMEILRQPSSPDGDWLDGFLGRVRAEVQPTLADDWTALSLELY